MRETISGVTVESFGGSPEDIRAVLDTFLQFWEANDALDYEKLGAVWSDEDWCHFFNSNGHIWRGLSDWESIWDYYRSRIRTTVPAAVASVQIHLSGDLAVVVDDGVHREFEWIGGEPTPDLFQSSKIRTTMVFQRYSEGWKAIHAHFSPQAVGDRPGD